MSSDCPAQLSDCLLAWCVAEIPKWVLQAGMDACYWAEQMLATIPSADTLRVVLAVLTSSLPPLATGNLCMGLVGVGKALPCQCSVRTAWCNNSEVILDYNPQSLLVSCPQSLPLSSYYITGPISAVVVKTSTWTLSSCNNWTSSCNLHSACINSWNCCTENEVDKGVASIKRLIAVLESTLSLGLLALLELA